VDLSENVLKFKKDIDHAVKHFWKTRESQLNDQKSRNSVDQGNRGAVTGGKQMDGFIALLTKIALHVGIPQEYIHTKSNYLPGFFRPSKDWDFIIITPHDNLVCSIELKSQVGSFGNNFNNRTEESLGSSFDLATSIAENGLKISAMPWIGYLVLLEHSENSIKSVNVQEKIYPVRDEFRNTSYMQRYDLFCKKLMLKQLYTSAALLWTKADHTYGSLSYETSIDFFLKSFLSNLMVRSSEFK
jgi:hypothetical protein